jgi:hypothetical protein
MGVVSRCTFGYKGTVQQLVLWDVLTDLEEELMQQRSSELPGHSLFRSNTPTIRTSLKLYGLVYHRPLHHVMK